MMELAARCALSVGNGSLHESRLQSSRLCNFLSIFSNSNLFIRKRNISCYLFGLVTFEYYKFYLHPVKDLMTVGSPCT